MSDSTTASDASTATAPSTAAGTLVVRDATLAQPPLFSPPAQMADDPLAAGLDYRRIWHSFRRRWLPAVALGTLLALAAAIAAHLHDRNRSFTLFATHYFELTTFAQAHPQALNVHVSAVESGHDIVFLHEIAPGPASRSYGVQVARLAGMPATVVRQARGTLESLEQRESASQAQVDLFAPPGNTQRPEGQPHAVVVNSSTDHEADPSAAVSARAVLALLEDLQPDALSPREALQALYRLKDAAQGHTP